MEYPFLYLLLLFGYPNFGLPNTIGDIANIGPTYFTYIEKLNIEGLSAVMMGSLSGLIIFVGFYVGKRIRRIVRSDKRRQLIYALLKLLTRPHF